MSDRKPTYVEFTTVDGGTILIATDVIRSAEEVSKKSLQHVEVMLLTGEIHQVVNSYSYVKHALTGKAS